MQKFEFTQVTFQESTIENSEGSKINQEKHTLSIAEHSNVGPCVVPSVSNLAVFGMTKGTAVPLVIPNTAKLLTEGTTQGPTLLCSAIDSVCFS